MIQKGITKALSKKAHMKFTSQKMSNQMSKFSRSCRSGDTGFEKENGAPLLRRPCGSGRSTRAGHGAWTRRCRARSCGSFPCPSVCLMHRHSPIEMETEGVLALRFVAKTQRQKGRVSSLMQPCQSPPSIDRISSATSRISDAAAEREFCSNTESPADADSA